MCRNRLYSKERPDMLDHRFTYPELGLADQRPRRTLVVRRGPRVRVVVVPAGRREPRPAATRS